jgi:hypothetical protein
MTKFILAIIFALSAVTSQAKEVFLTLNSDGTEAWYGYPETYTRLGDGYSILFARKYTSDNKQNARMYYAVTNEECSKGFGSLYGRVSAEEQWKIIAQFSIDANKMVGDFLAHELCLYGFEMDKKANKPETKKPRSKSI